MSWALANLTVRFGPVTALDDVSCTVRAGERVALCGPNGSGKSTLLAAFARLHAPDGVLVPQHVAPCAFRVRDYVMLGRTRHLSPWRRPAAADERAVADALAAVDAAPLAARRLDALSGGERQRIGVALALASGARVLLLDEPAAHLDLRRRRELYALLRALGRTVVMVQHEAPDPAFFTRVLLLARGRLVADGPVERVFTPEILEAAFS